MNKLYACLGSGNCFKPWLAMTQLDVPFDLHLIDVLKGEQKSDAYLAINPFGVVPYLRTGTDCGIGESNAMLWYLAESTDLMPKTPAARAQALQWMFFEQSKLEPFIAPARFLTTIVPDLAEQRAFEISNLQASARFGLTYLNDHLGDRTFMLNEGYTIADISIFGYVHVLEEAGLSMTDTPNIARWIDAVQQTDGFLPLKDLGRHISVAA